MGTKKTRPKKTSPEVRARMTSRASALARRGDGDVASGSRGTYPAPMASPTPPWRGEGPKPPRGLGLDAWGTVVSVRRD